MTDPAAPLVSVVIPTYNHGPLLRRALQSLLDQTYPHWEAIVVDNHSTDDTDAEVRPFLSDRVKMLKIHNNGVIAASRNMGIEAARGQWIALLDSDDWWTKDKLQAAMQAGAAGADVIYHDLTIVGPNRRPRPWRRARARRLHGPAFDDMVQNSNALPNSSVVVRRDLLAQIGGLNTSPDLIAWEDFDAWLRLAQIGARFVRLRGSYGFYWVGGQNMTNPQRTLANIDAFIAKYIGPNKPVPWWCHYSRAVCARMLGDKNAAAAHFAAAWRAGPNLWNRARIAAKYLQVKLT